MSDPHDDRMGRPDGHHYDAPESDEERTGKSWAYLALGTLVAPAADPDRHGDGADLPVLTGTFDGVQVEDVRRLFLGTFVRPPEETGGAPRVEAVYGYAVPHAGGLVLLDTGIGAADEETEAWYRPRRIDLERPCEQAAGPSTTSTSSSTATCTSTTAAATRCCPAGESWPRDVSSRQHERVVTPSRR